ncbi:hypothetical protein Tco_0868708, partial [Tanacetum coccineum]
LKKNKTSGAITSVGNGNRAAMEAKGSFDLILPNRLVIVLDNCNSVSKDNGIYSNAIPRDGIYEIDMHNLVPNDSSMGVGHFARNYTNKSMVGDSTYYTERLMLVQQEEARIEITAEQHDFLAYTSDEECEDREFNANCIFLTRLQSTSSNKDTALVYDTSGISEVPKFDNYYDNEICNLFAYEEEHLELHESTQATYAKQHNDSHVFLKL